MQETFIGNSISRAAEILMQNGVVAIPTETVYGLAGNALSPTAIAAIYAAKERPSFNPLILHTHSAESIKEYAHVNDRAYAIAKTFMPGALTLLLPKKNIVPQILTAGSNMVAIRVPKHPTSLALLQMLHFPLAAPSANKFGYISPTTAQHVLKTLEGKIPFILDGGTCEVGIESTIIEVTETEIILHRAGGLNANMVAEFAKLPLVKKEGGKIATSGQLKSHYAPTKPLMHGNVTELIANNPGKKIAIISFQKNYNSLNTQSFPLSKAGNLSEAASNLFQTLYTLDESDFDIIISEIFPSQGIGNAINDRLNRAQQIHK